MTLTSGCASIIGEDSQVVSVDTPECPSASCRMVNSQGVYFVKETPETIVINKAYGDLTVTCEKNGKREDSTHMSKANGATFGNILLGGIPGALIDGGSGAGYDYDDYIANPLNCAEPSTDSAALTSSINPDSIKKAEDRLRELKSLEDKGLVSREEAKKKRQDIIDSM